MASDRKKVTLDVAVKTEQAQIEALEKELDKAKTKSSELKQQKIQMKIEADTQKLEEVKGKIAELESKKAELKIGVDDSEIEATEKEIDNLRQKQVNLELEIEDAKLDEIQSKMDSIESDPINVQLENQSAMEGLQQIADGFSRIKSAASEVGQEFGALLDSAGKQETNFAFLANAVGDAETARQKMQEINDIVSQLPGDDTALQGLLSSAVAKDSSLTAENLRSMANSATDYFSAMSFYGKSAVEAQQDMVNYLLSGNTAELERSPILQAHIDKLKEANTVQERSQALAEALNAEHWGGMGAMDTYNNKLETFNGMIERGRYTLGGMFQEGAKGAMDFLLKLDESTNGLVGMTIAAAGFASPVTDAVMGLGQMATGIKALKDLSVFSKLREGITAVASAAKEAAITIGSTLKNALVSAAGAAKTAVTWLARTSKELLVSAANALRSAAAWAVEKASKLASAAATAIAEAAQWALNIAMSANPIGLLVIGITALIAVLGYLYFNNEWVRNSINALGADLWGLGETIYGSLMGAFEWLQGAWQNTIGWFTNGGQVIDNAVTGTFNWIRDTIYGTVVGAFEYLQGAWQNTVDWFTNGANTITDSLNSAWQWIVDGFNTVVDTFTTYAPLVAQVLFVMATGGVGAIVLLLANMNGMPNQIGGYLQNAINHVTDFASGLVNNFINAGKDSVTNFINQVSQMPGQFAAELQEMIDDAIDFAANLPGYLFEAGQNAVWGWLDGLGIHSPGTMQTSFYDELLGIVNLIPGIADLIGNNLGLIVDKAGEFTDQVSDKMENGMPASLAVVGTSMDWLANGAAQMVTAMGGNGQAFLDTWTSVRDGTTASIQGMVNSVANLPANIGGFLNSTASRVTNFASNFANNLYTAGANGVSQFMSQISSLPGKFSAELNNMLSAVGRWAATLPQKFWEAGVNAVRNFLNALGIHSPGFMQVAFLGEINAMEKLAGVNSIASNIGQTAKDVIHAWGNPTLSYNMELSNISVKDNSDNSSIETLLTRILEALNNTNNTPTAITLNHYGDTDNEEKLQRILDFIVREFNWDNETAGRTV